MKTTIVSRIYWPEPSAATSFLTAIADELCQRGHVVSVLTTRVPHDEQVGSRREQISRWPVLRDSSGYVRGYAEYMSFDIPLLLRLLFMSKPDVVLVEPPPTTGAVVRLICGLRRIPYVYDVADIWSDAVVNATSSRLIARVLRLIEQYALSGARALVTISQSVSNRLSHLKVTVPAHVTGFGADTDVFRYLPECERESVFVYGGTYSEIHGASILVRGFAEFQRTHPQYTLRFLGNGTERESLEALARELGIHEDVEFMPPMPADQLAVALNQAQAALASLSPESNYAYAFTTKAYSALSSGCPVIFAGPGPTKTLFELAPSDVRPGYAADFDEHAVAEVMAKLAANPLTGAERERLSKWSHTEHSMNTVAVRVVDVLEATAQQNSESRV